MQCPQCASDAPAGSEFCPKCGAQLAASPTTQQRATARPRPGTGGDDTEQEIWTGTYSPKAMTGVWVVLGLVTIAGLVVGGLQGLDGMMWSILIGIIVLAWLVSLAVLLVRRLGIKYRLTSQRLFHERGVITRQIDRIEVIKMDDVTCKQGLLERMLGTGSIKIESSDQSDPVFVMIGVDNVREVTDLIDQARRADQVRRKALMGTGWVERRRATDEG